MSRSPELPSVNPLAAVAQDFMLDMTLEDVTNQRGWLTEAYDKALQSVDVLVLPTIPHLAVPIPSLDADFGECMSRALGMINTPQFDLTGHPAISVPCGVSEDLPIGFPDRRPPFRRPHGARSRRRGGERRLAKRVAAGSGLGHREVRR